MTESSEEESGLGANTSNEFEMPPSDGIESGVPLSPLGAMGQGNSQKNQSQAKDLSPESFNKRMLNNQNMAASTGPGFGGNKIMASGLTIKFKLISSLGILTFLIVVLGLASVFAINNLNTLSDSIYEQYAPLARTSEEIKATVYKIRRAEQEFLLNEEQSALDTSNRLITLLRGQIDEALEIGDEIAQITGVKSDSRIKSLNEVLDNYEQTFSNQVKNIKQARSDIDLNLEKVEKLKSQLLNQITVNKQTVQGIVDDYWISGKLKLNNASSVKIKQTKKLVDDGILIQNLNTSLRESESYVARYLQENIDLHADSAFKEIEAAINIANRIRRESNDDAIIIKMATVLKRLEQYRSVVRAGQTTNTEVFQIKGVLEKDIQQQKVELAAIGERLLKNATELSNGAWEQVGDISRQQVTSGNFNQLLLVATMIIGTLIGILVLWLIPRPILNSINQLLQGAQNVANGDLTQIINVNSNDELAVLANTFNTMRNNLFSLVDRIKKATVQISTTVNEIQAASTEQAGTASEQASTITEFSATLREISQNSQALLTTANTVAKDANDMTDYVNETNSRSKDMMTSMSNIGDSTEQTSERIKSLNDQMDGIVDAVDVIASVSDQTTLLSLNAAIEANKAGEMGKGFAVVATEIRRLADRSVDSADTINTLIRDIQRSAESSLVSMDKSSSEIKQGVNLVEQSSDAMGYLNQNIGRVNEQTQSISGSINQQAKASQDVESTAAQLLESSRMTSQAANQTSAASYELASMANQLSEAVAAFKI